MYLVMGITGRVGAATARHLLSRGKQVRSLVRSREKATSWAAQGVELFQGDWNDADAIEQALHGVEGAYVMLPAVYTPSRDFRESKGVITAYSRAFAEVQPPRIVALSANGADKSSALGAITPLALMEQAFAIFHFQSRLFAPAAFTRTSSTACRRLRAVRCRYSTSPRAGSWRWSQLKTSPRRRQSFLQNHRGRERA